MNLIEELFSNFNAKYLEEAKSKSIDLGLQTVYTPIDKIEQATGFRFADHITSKIRSVAVLFNTEFINYFVKELPQDYIKNIKFTFFYDCEFDRAQVEDCIFFSKIKLNIEMIYIENIKDLNKVMAGKKFDIVFSNPPYSGSRELANIDVKIFNFTMKISNELIFIMPNACFIANLWKDLRKTHPDYIAQQQLDKLEKMIIINPSVFNGNCAKENNVAIVYFNNKKTNSEFEYIDPEKNVKRTFNSKNQLNQFSSFSENVCFNLGKIKGKIDNWIENKNDFFSNHANGGDYGRKPMNVEKITQYINNMSNYSFWLPCVNGGTCKYFNEDGIHKNEWYCAINRGNEEHHNKNFNIEKNVEYIFNLGSARLMFNASSKEDAERNWKFITHSPIAKLIMVFYREDRNIYYKWFPWLSENKTFKELCNEIGITNEEMNFIKDFFKDIKPISWD